MQHKDEFIDLHIHSTISDGTWEPGKVASVVKEKNVGVFSITDHDITSGVVEGEKYAVLNKLHYIRGVEISSSNQSDWEHILAYGVDLDNTDLNQLLKENREKIINKDEVAIQILNRKGFPVSFEDYSVYTYDKTRGGFKLLNYLIDKNLCTDVGDFFKKFSDIDPVSQFPQYKSVADVVKIIKQAGGVPVLAHPFYTKKDYENIHDRLKIFLNQGIEGIECFHPSHDLKVANACMKFCKINNLIMTAGSDCHGDFIASRKIGMHKIKVRDINLGKLEDYIV